MYDSYCAIIIDAMLLAAGISLPIVFICTTMNTCAYRARTWHAAGIVFMYMHVALYL